MRFWILTAIAAGCLSLMGAGKKAQSFIVSFHVEGTEAEAPKFSQAIRLGTEGKVYYFEILPTITDKDIAWFYPFVSKDGRSFGAAFKMRPGSIRSLQAVTMKKQGKLLGIRIADAPLSAVMIDRPIDDGIIVVWDGLGQKHLQMFKQRFPHVEDLQKARNVNAVQ